MRPSAQSDLSGSVGTAVIHADDMIENRAHICDYFTDDSGFVEGGNDDPDAGVTRFDTQQDTRWSGRMVSWYVPVPPSGR